MLNLKKTLLLENNYVINKYLLQDFVITVIGYLKAYHLITIRQNISALRLFAVQYLIFYCSYETVLKLLKF